MMPTTRSRITTPMVAGLMLGVFVLFFAGAAQPARAVTCDEWGTGFGAKVDSTNHFGASGTATVVTASSSCILVRSAYVKLDFDNAAEVGWFKDGSQQSVYVCDNTTTPHVFAWARTLGQNLCKPGTPAVTGSAAYRVENPSHDNTIEYYYNGQPQGYFLVSFTQGESQSWSEHHAAGENLIADWSSLRYLGNAGSWNLWSTITTLTSGDTSGFKRCSYSATHWAVKTSSATC